MCDVGVDFNESNFFQNLVGTKPLNMPIELVKQVIDQMSSQFNGAKLGFGFTEPLIYPQLEEALGYARDRGVFTSLTTNALNLKRFSDRLINGGLREINISLDGPPEIHNFIRGHKSSFQRAIEGIEALLEHEQRPQISVYCVITEWNIGHLEKFVSIFQQYPLENLGFMHTNFTSAEMAEDHNTRYGNLYPATPSNMEEINIEKMDLPLLWKEIQAIKQMPLKARLIFSPELRSQKALEDFYHRPEIFMGKRCNDIFHNIMVKSNGDVIPAHGRCYNLTIGNMYESDLKSIWNSQVIRDFRQTVSQAGGLLPACSRCCSGYGE